ncbi:MAG: peptidase M61, partial [Burkholderiaceae bacterium]
GSDLDTLMRDLWNRTGGGSMTEAMVYESLIARGFENVAAQLRQWVHSTEDLPIARLLEAVGVRVTPKPAPLPQRLGMRVNEASGIRIAHVARGGAGEDAGFAAGDEWLAAGYSDDMWRVKTLSDVERIAKWQTQRPDEALSVWYARDGRMMKSTLRWPQADARAVAQLVITDHAKLATWLKP